MPRKKTPPVEEPARRRVNVERGKYARLFKRHRITELELGQTYSARRGVDFDCLPASFGNYVRQAAMDMGLSAAVSVVGDEVIYSYYPGDALWRPRLNRYPVVLKAIANRRR